MPSSVRFAASSSPSRLAECCVGYYPRLALLLPAVFLLGAILGTHPSLRNGGDLSASSLPAKVPPPAPSPVPEWSMDWLGNVQAIQNLMGAV